MSRKSTVGRIIKKAAIGIVLVAVMVGACVAMLQTAFARKCLARRAEGALSSALNSDVVVSALDGIVPFDVRIAHLSATRAGVTWLEVDDFGIRWSPLSLLIGRLSIHELRAGKVEVRHPPELVPAVQSAGALPLAIPRWMSRATVEKLDVDRLELDEEVLGKKTVLRVDARMKRSAWKQKASASVRIVTIEGTDPGLTLDVEGHYDEPYALITADVSARDVRWKAGGLESVCFTARMGEDFSKTSGLQAHCILSATGLSLERQDAQVPFALTAKATLTNGLFTLSADVIVAQSDVLEMNCTLPVDVSLSRLTARVLEDQPVSGSVRGITRMESLASFQEQRLTGDVEMSLFLNGSARDPLVTGRADLRNGTYENLVLGTVLTNLDVALIAEDRRLTINGFSCAGTDGGAVRLAGSITARPSAHYPFDATLQFDNAQIVQRDDITAAVSGRLNVAGSSAESATTGHLRIIGGEFDITDRLPVESLVIDEVDAGAPDVAQRDSPPTRRLPQWHNATIDLHVTTSEQVAVRGRGLDSQWTADCHVAGNARMPSITGEFKAIRGRFDLFGRSFTVVSGKIVLDGAVPPAPRIDAVGEAQGGGITALVKMSGLLSSPQITVESDPILPVDEILARLLFTRTVSSITPLQAVQLAMAAQSLVGGGSKLGAMDRTRRALRVDQLSFDAEEQDGEQRTSVTVGKNVGSRVYVESEAGVTPGNNRIAVAVQITPDVSFLTETSSQLRDGVSIRWQHNY